MHCFKEYITHQEMKENLSILIKVILKNGSLTNQVFFTECSTSSRKSNSVQRCPKEQIP